jgi:hypothetical protein
MSNTITFSLSPLSLSSREALHEVLLILCHHLLVNRTLELQKLTDIDSVVFQGITYVRKKDDKGFSHGPSPHLASTTSDRFKAMEIIASNALYQRPWEVQAG